MRKKIECKPGCNIQSTKIIDEGNGWIILQSDDKITALWTRPLSIGKTDALEYRLSLKAECEKDELKPTLTLKYRSDKKTNFPSEAVVKLVGTTSHNLTVCHSSPVYSIIYKDYVSTSHFPIDDEDLMDFFQGKSKMVLFYQGVSYPIIAGRDESLPFARLKEKVSPTKLTERQKEVLLHEKQRVQKKLEAIEKLEAVKREKEEEECKRKQEEQIKQEEEERKIVAQGQYLKQCVLVFLLKNYSLYIEYEQIYVVGDPLKYDFILNNLHKSIVRHLKSSSYASTDFVTKYSKKDTISAIERYMPMTGIDKKDYFNVYDSFFHHYRIFFSSKTEECPKYIESYTKGMARKMIEKSEESSYLRLWDYPDPDGSIATLKSKGIISDSSWSININLTNYKKICKILDTPGRNFLKERRRKRWIIAILIIFAIYGVPIIFG